jgi:hypothetical protein
MLVFPAPVLAVHELRYMFAYGSRASSELSAHGDHYVTTAALIAGGLVGLALAAGVGRLLATFRGQRTFEVPRIPVWMLWLGLAVLLLVGFWALEGIELIFESSRGTSAVARVFADGGLWAVPAAMFVAALMALLVSGGRALLGIVVRRRTLRRVGTVPGPHPPVQRALLPRRPMAGRVAGRAPPALVAK